MILVILGHYLIQATRNVYFWLSHHSGNKQIWLKHVENTTLDSTTSLGTSVIRSPSSDQTPIALMFLENLFYSLKYKGSGIMASITVRETRYSR